MLAVPRDNPAPGEVILTVLRALSTMYMRLPDDTLDEPFDCPDHPDGECTKAGNQRRGSIVLFDERNEPWALLHWAVENRELVEFSIVQAEPAVLTRWLADGQESTCIVDRRTN